MMNRSHLGTPIVSNRNSALRPFTYRALVEFLVLVENELENVGDQLLEWQHAVN